MKKTTFVQRISRNTWLVYALGLVIVALQLRNFIG